MGQRLPSALLLPDIAARGRLERLVLVPSIRLFPAGLAWLSTYFENIYNISNHYPGNVDACDGKVGGKPGGKARDLGRIGLTISS